MKKFSKIISIILCVSLFSTFLSGCVKIPQAESAVKHALWSLKSGTLEDASEFMDVDKIINASNAEISTLPINENVLLEKTFRTFKYKIISSKIIDEKTVNVKIKLTTIDMQPILTEFSALVLQYCFTNSYICPAPSRDEVKETIEKYLTRCTSKKDLMTTTNELDIKVYKVKDTWRIDLDDNLVNALLGNWNEALLLTSDSDYYSE